MKLLSNTDFVPRLPLMFPVAGVLQEVDEDDAVWSVQENDAMPASLMVDHRWQALLMPVGNVLKVFYTDMGPSSDFMVMVDEAVYPSPAFQQIILEAHTVAECRDMADDGRNDDWAVRMLHEQTQQSTVIEDWRQIVENDLPLIRNASTFGPAGKVERNGYSRAGARRQLEILNDH